MTNIMVLHYMASVKVLMLSHMGVWRLGVKISRSWNIWSRKDSHGITKCFPSIWSLRNSWKLKEVVSSRWSLSSWLFRKTESRVSSCCTRGGLSGWSGWQSCLVWSGLHIDIWSSLIRCAPDQTLIRFSYWDAARYKFLQFFSSNFVQKAVDPHRFEHLIANSFDRLCILL